MANEARLTPSAVDDLELRNRLSRLQYQVTREKATEHAFTGKYWNCDENGIYRCICCNEGLFDSMAKFDAGCGWPSFRAPINTQGVRHVDDFSHNMHRVEVICGKCDAHLGHVFPDGPAPAGQRYCINSASLDLKSRG